MQGYDSVAMDVDVEVGGNDQLFNMFVGRELQKKYNNKEKFVITTTLLVNPKTGKKLMSKSEGSYIALSDSPNDMYGKAMALPDETIIQVFTDCTFVGLDEIHDHKNALSEGKNPRDIKMKLANALVGTYHNESVAKDAEHNFISTFQKKETPKEAQKIKIKKGDFLGKSIVKNGILKSNTEFKRLVEEGAVRNMDTGEKIYDHTFVVKKEAVFRIGKKKFVRVVVEN